tara:strand:- start:4645 stop:4986 length:342 start_codon:yes stop_codon:yes gene_type:complete
MMRLLSPLLIWAFIKTNRDVLKRLLLIAFSYLFILIIFTDFEAVFFSDNIIAFKLIKWLIIACAFIHVAFLFKTLKPQRISKKETTAIVNAPILLTRSQKIINKHKDTYKDGA